MIPEAIQKKVIDAAFSHDVPEEIQNILNNDPELEQHLLAGYAVFGYGLAQEEIAQKDKEITILYKKVNDLEYEIIRLKGLVKIIAERFFKYGAQEWAARFKSDRLSNDEDFVEINKIITKRWQQFEESNKLNS